MLIFGIEDICCDNCIDFVGGICGLSELVCLVDNGSYLVVFVMYLLIMDDLFSVVDVVEIMLLKLIWFELKLLSGLFVYDLESK